MSCDDLLMAFFPCIHFCDAKTLFFKGKSISQKGWSIERMMEYNITLSQEREMFFTTLMKMFAVAGSKGLRLITENPWNPSGETYLQRNFIEPTIIDNNRMIRGDYFVKPTAYWFVNCTNTNGLTWQKDKAQEIVMKKKKNSNPGECSEERSMISPDYARNFICDFIIGRDQPEIDPKLF